MKTEADGFEREIAFTPAFDRRDGDPPKNYGVHGVSICFYLKKNNRATQFVLYSGMMLPHVQREHRDSGYSSGWMGADIGYHSPEPTYEGQRAMDGKCSLIDGPCFYDGSSLNAGPIADRFIAEGESAVWEELMLLYLGVFPDQTLIAAEEKTQ